LRARRTAGGLQPVLEDLDVDGVVRRPNVAGPEVGLPEAHPVEPDRRAIVQAVPLLLGVEEGWQHPLDDAALASAVVRRAEVARREAPRDHDWLAGAEAGRRRRAGWLTRGARLGGCGWVGRRARAGGRGLLAAHRATPSRSFTASIF